MKKPPTAFIVDNRASILSSLEAALKTHGFPVQCYKSAAEFIADQDSNRVGCVLVDPMSAAEGDRILRWLHGSGSLLSIVVFSGLFEPSSWALSESLPVSDAQRPHQVSALLTMVADGLAGSLSRQVIRERSQG